MQDLIAYGSMFLSALGAATVLPFQSEPVLVALILREESSWLGLVAAATVGNVLGAMVNWALGKWAMHYRDRTWFPVTEKTYQRAHGWYERWGKWSLLLAWTPFLGDPLTVVAGVLGVELRTFVVLVTLGKAARYLFLAGATLGWMSV